MPVPEMFDGSLNRTTSERLGKEQEQEPVPLNHMKELATTITLRKQTREVERITQIRNAVSRPQTCADNITYSVLL